MSQAKKIEVLSLARSQARIFLLFGIFAGILYSFGGFIVDTLVSLDWISTDDTPGLSYGTLLAFGALIGMPIIGAVFGFITGLIVAFTHNLIASRFPWLRIHL